MRALLRTVNLVASGLMAGGQLMALRTIVPARREVSPSEGIRIHQRMLDVRADSYLRPLGIAGGTSAALLGLLELRAGRVDPLMAVSFAASLGVIGVSVTGEFPINRTIRDWDPEVPPPEYPKVRETWDQGHAIRTALGLASFAAAALSAVRAG